MLIFFKYSILLDTETKASDTSCLPFTSIFPLPMFKKLALYLLLLFSCHLSLVAQNLVPNPSFEQLRNLPVKNNPKNTFEYEPKSGYIPYMQNLSYWFAATETTPDLRISSQDQYSKCRKLYKNCDKARTGSNCVGIITFMSNSTSKTYREYLQIKLRERLRPNEKTYVELWVSKERQAKLISNNMGIHFSLRKTTESTLENLELKPQINFDTLINQDEKKWIKLRGSFIPDKPYLFMLIGNFYNNEQTKAFWFESFNGNPYTPPYAYYLIDDVRVWQENDKPEPPLLMFNDQVLNANEPIALKNVEFDFDSAELQDSSFAELQRLRAFLSQNPDVKIALQGHTDASGSDLYNQSLSEQRAKSVFTYLVEQGIKAERLSYKGFGEANPVKDNDSDEGRSRNRRVEFLVIEQ